MSMSAVSSTNDDTARLTGEWLAEAVAVAESDEYTRKGRAPRTEWNVSLDVHVCPDGVSAEIIYASSRDISEGGIAFRSRKALPAYTSIRICRAGEEAGASARVMTSDSSVGGFIVAAQFCD